MNIVSVEFCTPACYPGVTNVKRIAVLTQGAVDDYAAYHALVPMGDEDELRDSVLLWIASHGTKMREGEARRYFLFPAGKYRA